MTLGSCLRDRGWRSDVAALAPVEAPALDVPVVGAAVRSPSGWKRLRRLAAGYDVVVAHGSSTLPACGLSLLGTGVPFVYVNIGDPLFWAGTPARRLRVALLLRRAAAVAAISSGTRAILLEQFRVPADRVTVIPNARSGAGFRPADPARRLRARRQLGLPADDLAAVLVLGALSREKRVDLAVRVVAAVPETRLVVAGEGPLREELEALARRLAPGRVSFLGNVSEPALALASADALLLTSESEGVPGVLIEAGLAGVPAVTADVGWVRDVVEHGRTGMVLTQHEVPLFAEGLREVLRRRATFGLHARELCLERFDLPRVVDRWEELLTKVIATR